jgi:hypothetical protein
MVLVTHKMFKKAFGDNALGHRQTDEWFKCFNNGQMSTAEEFS